jgi:hypothetical protein
MGKIEDLLNQVYYVNKNYDSAKELYRKAKLLDNTISYEDVSKWLKKQATSQLTTTPIIGKKKFKKIYNEDHYSYQIDLTFLPKYKTQNKNNYVLFTAINVNSRYAYVNYGQDKTTETILRMLNQFMKDAITINSITMDSGSEFTNDIVKKWFDKNDITTYYVVGDSHKLGIINRFHRTLKDKLLKHFLASQTTNWTSVIYEIVKNYNNTKNRGIGFTPTEASKNLIQSHLIAKAREFNDKLGDQSIINVGDTCRIKKKKNLFDKMGTEFSDETYKIIKVYKNKVDIGNDKTKINDVKKTDIVIVNDVIEREVSQENKAQTERINNNIRKLKKIDVQEENIINAPRIRKPKVIFDL